MVDWQKALFELSDTRILFYLKEKKAARYYELSDHVIENRSTLATSLKGLQAAGLIERKVKDTRPIRTEYRLTPKGERFVESLLVSKKILGL